MRESGYYPPGAEFDPNAPYNQVDPPEQEFEITITQTLSKSLSVFTDQYNFICDMDEDGVSTEYDTSDTNWYDVYAENHHTPLQLIALFKRMLEQKEEIPERLRQQLIEECSEWCEEECEIVEN